MQTGRLRKVNRSLTEGRKRFFDRFAEIQSGESCARFQPMLSAAADGEASNEERRLLEAHLRACHSCRALLRGYRAVPARLAELLPPTILAPALQRDGWWSRLSEEIVGGVGDRVAAVGQKIQQLGEAFSAQKATAVVASTAAIAGGAVVQERSLERRGEREHHRAGHARAWRASESETAPVPATQPPAVGRDEEGAARPPSLGEDESVRSRDEVTPAAEAASVEEFLPDASAPAASPTPPASAAPNSPPPSKSGAPESSHERSSAPAAEFGP